MEIPQHDSVIAKHQTETMMKKLTKMFSFSGDAKRAKFWQFVLFALVFWLAAAYVDETFLAPNLCLINEEWFCYLPGEVREGITLDKIASVLLIIPFFSILVRRLRDHLVSPYLALLAIPGSFALGAFLYFPAQELPLWVMIVCGVLFLPLLYWMLTKGKKKSKADD